MISEVLHITYIPLGYATAIASEADDRAKVRDCHRARTVSQQSGEHRKAAETLADTLRTVLEETDIRISELNKDAYELADIVVGAELRGPQDFG